MDSTKPRRNIQKWIGYCTIFEAVVWFLLVVMVQFGLFMPSRLTICSIFMENEKTIEMSIFPGIFFAFLWIYTILYFFWFFSSYFVINISKENEVGQKKLLRMWCALTLLISFVDVCSSIYFGMVYNNCVTSARRVKCDHFDNVEETCFHEIFPMFLITGKCGVFWLANIAFAVVMVKLAAKLDKRPPQAPQTILEVSLSVIKIEDDPPPSYEVAVAMGRENMMNQTIKESEPTKKTFA